MVSMATTEVSENEGNMALHLKASAGSREFYLQRGEAAVPNDCRMPDLSFISASNLRSCNNNVSCSECAGTYRTGGEERELCRLCTPTPELNEESA